MQETVQEKIKDISGFLLIVHGKKAQLCTAIAAWLPEFSARIQLCRGHTDKNSLRPVPEESVWSCTEIMCKGAH